MIKIYVNINAFFWQIIIEESFPWYLEWQGKTLSGNKCPIPIVMSLLMYVTGEWGSSYKSWLFLLSGYLVFQRPLFKLSTHWFVITRCWFGPFYLCASIHVFRLTCAWRLKLGLRQRYYKCLSNTMYLSHNHHPMNNNVNNCATAVWQVWMP